MTKSPEGFPKPFRPGINYPDLSDLCTSIIKTMISNPNSKQEIIDKALNLFDEGYTCSQSVLLALPAGLNWMKPQPN